MSSSSRSRTSVEKLEAMFSHKIKVESRNTFRQRRRAVNEKMKHYPDSLNRMAIRDEFLKIKRAQFLSEAIPEVLKQDCRAERSDCAARE